MSSLARLATQMFAMVLAAVVLLAAAGPLIDHHFAERQSGHLHLPSSSLAAHTHTYQSGMHLHAPPDEVSDQPVAIYRYDGVTSAVPAVFAADAWLASILSFEPSSLILLPMVAERAVRQTFTAPPGHPPQLPT